MKDRDGAGRCTPLCTVRKRFRNRNYTSRVNGRDGHRVGSLVFTWFFELGLLYFLWGCFNRRGEMLLKLMILGKCLRSLVVKQGKKLSLLFSRLMEDFH